MTELTGKSALISGAGRNMRKCVKPDLK